MIRTESDRLDIIPNNQFGFRPHHSTSHALLKFIVGVNEAFVRHDYTIICFLDFERAFDKVWHDGLLFKMMTLGFYAHLIRLIQAYLSDSSFSVAVDGDLSQFLGVDAGSLQGSVVGPLLYTIFYSDLPSEENVETDVSADDNRGKASVSQLCIAANRIQRWLTKLKEFNDRWRLKVNPSKSQAVIFRRRQLPKTLLPLFSGEEPVRYVQSVKHLGLSLTQKMTFYAHVTDVISKAKQRQSKLHRF